MAYNPDIHHRRSIRLRDYDYSRTGAYFVTICAWQRECLFGEVADGMNALSPNGQIVLDVWENLPHHYPHAELDEFVVMPNHVHGIIVLHGETHTDRPGAVDVGAGCDVKVEAVKVRAGCGVKVRAGLKPAPTVMPMKRHGLSEIVRGFKTFSARRINQLRDTPGVPVWQRNYYERIIRDERELEAIRQYINDNPITWHDDENHPCRV
ncbi:MAG: transposase [Desulfuromonadaceae bacterium]|nr:transposase [Desulfuromonadaceae bacterium]